jgi:hypothetical protein
MNANSGGTDPVNHARRVVATILIVGWAIALGVYVTAPPPVPEDEQVSGEIDDMEHSKTHLRQIEMVGGKAAVFTAELNEGIASLWEGRTRAFTIAGLTVALAGGYVLIRRAARPVE